ncbi:MAG: DUF1440 domain-containing protein [Chloroflexia bacterium]|jgi:hypothetical protein|nr:DUF1440 domain-containing protein [Chloroflexia bacterium]
MSHHASPLEVTIKGAVAGLAGTAVLTQVMQRGPQLMEEKLGIAIAGSDSPAEAEAPEDPRAELAEKVATGVFETNISQESKETASQAIHWGYGALWGAIFGIVHSSLKLPLLLHGTIFGSLVATVASTLVPAMGLAPSSKEQPKKMSAMQFVNHLIFGWAVALTFHVLTMRDE